MYFKKKILYFIESGGVYGAENVILNLSKEMLTNKQYEPLIGCIVQKRSEKSELFDKARSLGINAFKIVINNKHLPIDIPLVAIMLKRKKIDLIHSHGYKPSVVGFFIRLITGIPIIATCHLWFRKADCPWKYKLMTKLEIFLYRFYPIIVAVSKPIREYLIGAHVKKEKIRIINNGIVIKNNDGDDRVDKLRKKLNLKNDIPVILNLGRLTQQKDQKNIIFAAKILRAKSVNVYFLIAGEGELRKYLEDLIKSNGLENEVRLLGFRDDIKDLLKLADLFLLSSLDEGLPMSLLEAMAHKTPVISTSVGQIPEVIKDGTEGILIPNNSGEIIAYTIKTLLDEPKRMKKIADEAFRKVQREYSAFKMMTHYDKIYNQILF